METEYKSLYEARKELRKMRRAERKELRKKQSKEMVQAYEEAERKKQIEARRSIIKGIERQYPNADLTAIYEQFQPEYDTDDAIIDDISTDVDMLPSDEEIQAVQNEAENKKEISLPKFSIDDIKGIKSFDEMKKVDPNISEKDYQHAVNAWHIAQEAGKKIGVDPRLLFGQFGVETLFRDSSVLEQYNYGNIKHFDKWGKSVPQYEGQKSYRDNLIPDNVDYYKRFNTIDEAIEWYAQRYAEDGKSPHSLKGDAKKDPLAFSKSLYESGYYEGDPNLLEAQRPIAYMRGIVAQANKWLSGDALTAKQYSDDPYYTDPVEAIADSKEEPKKAKPLINPYGQDVPLQGPKGILKQPQLPQVIREGERNLSDLPNLISEPKNKSGKRPTLEIRDTEFIYPTSPSYDELYGKAHSGSWDTETSVSFNDPGEQSWATTTKREFIKGSESVSAADVGIANPNKDKSTSSLFHGGIQAPVAGALLAGSNIASLDTLEKVATMKGKALSEEQSKKEAEQKNIDSLTKATKGANAINAVNAAVGLGLGIYGASQINKMQRPAMVSAPQIEAAKIRDTGAQMMAARKGMIEQSANTSREALRRAGRSDLNATITAGETRAINEAAGSIEGMRANINAANVAAENRVREINASTKMQADQFNSQIQASFNQFKSQLGSQNLSTTVQNVSANLGGIAQNNYAKALRERDEEQQMKIARLIHSKE